MDKIGEGPYLVGRVNRSNLRRLCDGDYTRLNMMLVADPVIRMGDTLDRQFAIGCRNRQQFASGEFFRSAALVGVNVRGFAANDCMVRTCESFKAQAIGRSAVENDVNTDVVAKMLAKSHFCRFCVLVVTITDSVA